MAAEGRSNRFILVAVILGLAALSYICFREKYRLRAEMPAEFVDDSKPMTPQKQAQEEKLARGYWRCAIALQWKYGYGHRLPDDPPPEFLVTPQDVGTAAADTGSRTRYWKRFQRIWYVPNHWEKTYAFDFSELGQWLQSGGTRLELWLRRLTGSSW